MFWRTSRPLYICLEALSAHVQVLDCQTFAGKPLKLSLRDHITHLDLELSSVAWQSRVCCK